MFPTDKSKQYPYLTAYLNYLSRRRFPVAGGIPASAVAWVAAVAGSVLLVFGPMVHIAPWLLIAVPAIPITYFATRPKRAKTPEQEKSDRAKAVGSGLLEMIRRRRLHRDLDPASLAVLEECARFWSQATGALQSQYWSSDLLPLEYRSVRDQALSAVESSMEDVMILYENQVPDRIDGRPPMDYVEEALETYVFKQPTVVAMPPAAFAPARDIAEKLRALSDEAERVSIEVVSDPTIFAQAKPGRALDVTLSELRQIRIAEQELRQDLEQR